MMDPSILGLTSECDLPLDIIKEEPNTAEIGDVKLERDEDLVWNGEISIDVVKEEIQENDEIDISIPSRKLKKTTASNTTQDKQNKKINKNKVNCSTDSKSNIESKHTIESRVRSYNCATCQKTFLYKCHLDVHSRTHVDDKPYQCKECLKKFRSKSTLIIHIRKHTGEKPHTCVVCKKCFTQKNDLIKHFRIHTGEKPYKCNLCSKSFNQKTGLNVHARIHTGEKPYHCDVCKKCFSDNGSYKQHILIHSVHKPYNCETCNKGFARKRHLIRHMSSYHKH